MSKHVRDLMSKDVVTIHPDAPLVRAAEIMVKKSIRHLVVTDTNGIVVGLISQRDVVKQFSPWLTDIPGTQKNQFGPPPRCYVKDAMVSHPIMVTEDTTLQTAAGLLAEKKFGCLPVIDDNKRPVGILSVVDLLIYLSEQKQDADEEDQEFEYYRQPAIIDKDNNLVIPTAGLSIPENGPIFATIGYRSSSRCLSVMLLAKEKESGARQVNRVKKDFIIPVADILDHFQIEFRGPFEVADDDEPGQIILSPIMSSSTVESAS